MTELAVLLQAIWHDQDRRASAIAAVAAILGGIAWAATGSGWGAVPIAVGLWLLGFADRRLLVLAAVALLPSLALFNPYLVATIGGSPLDFRLLMTGGLAIAVGWWVAADRVRPDRVGLLFGAFVATAAILAFRNDEAPLRALPALGRYVAYLVVLIGSRRWFSTGGGALIGAAIIAGAAGPAVAALVQAIAGDALYQNAADRLTGVYRTSPVGLALAMQFGALAIATSRAFRSRPRDRVAWTVVALFAVYSFVLVETSTRLVYASCVFGLVLVEALRPRWRAVPIVIVAAALILLSQPDLMGRFTSTGTPGASPSAPPVASPSAPPVASPSATLSPSSPAPTEPGGSPEPGEAAGDASLRFRIFIWKVALDEWRASPLLGLGTGSFSTILERETGLVRIAPHNDYLGILVENGIVGAALYLWFQVAVALALVRRLRRTRSTSQRELLIAALVIFVTSNVLNAINNAILYVDLQTAVMALLGTALAVSAPGTSADPDPSTA